MTADYMIGSSLCFSWSIGTPSNHTQIALLGLQSTYAARYALDRPWALIYQCQLVPEKLGWCYTPAETDDGYAVTWRRRAPFRTLSTLLDTTLLH